ncbi:MAG: two-component system response regulator BtsR [Terriglobales bacterium]
MMRALIVDDEPYAREELEALLLETGEFVVVGSCANVLEALREVRKEMPEVLFLDIQMNNVSGFELLSMIDPEIMPRVVFVTAFDEYAVQAFERDALDYLVKPVRKNRLAKTVRKLKENLDKGKRPVYATPDIQKIPCVLIDRIKLISPAEVDCVRSDLAGVHVVCSKGEFFTELTLKVLEDKTDLFRCHKQFLVNLKGIDEIVFRESSLAEVRMKTGLMVPVGRRFLQKLKDALGI